eukprot:Opistho-2@91594
MGMTPWIAHRWEVRAEIQAGRSTFPHQAGSDPDIHQAHSSTQERPLSAQPGLPPCERNSTAPASSGAQTAAAPRWKADCWPPSSASRPRSSVWPSCSPRAGTPPRSPSACRSRSTPCAAMSSSCWPRATHAARPSSWPACGTPRPAWIVASHRPTPQVRGAPRHPRVSLPSWARTARSRPQKLRPTISPAAQAPQRDPGKPPNDNASDQDLHPASTPQAQPRGCRQPGVHAGLRPELVGPGGQRHLGRRQRQLGQRPVLDRRRRRRPGLLRQRLHRQRQSAELRRHPDQQLRRRTALYRRGGQPEREQRRHALAVRRGAQQQRQPPHRSRELRRHPCTLR